MARDYSSRPGNSSSNSGKRKPTRRKPAARPTQTKRTKSGGPPGWVWMICGLCIGLTVAAVFYIFARPGGDLAREQIEIVEAVSAIDGSVGWCTHISSEINALVIRRMQPEFAHQIFDDWDALVCSGLGPANGPNPGRQARRDGAGWQLNFQGSFEMNLNLTHASGWW